MISKIKKVSIKSILKFLFWFCITYLVIEGIEILIDKYFHLELRPLTTWAGLIIGTIIYGFKFHLFCCLFPFLYATYKCKHKECKHDHCHVE